MTKDSTVSSEAKAGIGAIRVKAKAATLPNEPTPLAAMEADEGGEGGRSATEPLSVTIAPNEGGEGGAPALPPSPPSNAGFVTAIFGTLPAGTAPVICSKPGDPQDGGWRALPADDVDIQCPTDANNYFACSTFKVAPDGTVQARKDSFDAFYVVVLDDVGTKVPRERLGGVVPTWEVETSPGNSQVGFLLADPIRDARLAEQLQDAVVAAGLSDPGAKGVARWVRLLIGINGKAKYRDVGGRPFRCRVVHWNRTIAFTVDELVETLGLQLAPTTPTVGSPNLVSPVLARGPSGDGIWTPAPSENPVITALKERRLYKRALGNGRHDVTCPWVNEHTDALDDGSAYFEPNIDYPVGGFKCHHSHGDHRRFHDLLENLGVKEDAARGKASVLVAPGEMHRVVRAAEKVLAATGSHYQMGGAIVRVRIDPVTGDAATELLNEAQLSNTLSMASDWFGYKPGGQDKPAVRIRIDPKPNVVQALARSGQYEFLPPLAGVTRQPWFRSDGSLVTVPGYDPASRLYGAFDATKFRFLEPTEAAARAALADMQTLLDEFHFSGPGDRSAALGAMLTAAMRPSLPVAPAFNITASAPGSGKSYLAKMVASFASPGQPLNLSYPITADEASKAVLAALIASPAVVSFDDMQSQWLPHGAMNRMLTSETVTDRILGSTRTVTVSTRSLVLGTGNNVGPIRDMNRRVVTIRLHHASATPSLVSYAGNPAAAVAADRGRYVAAALTIVAAYRHAGAPDMGLPSIATYEAWSGSVRSALVWLGLPDPAASLIAQVEHDPDQAILAALLEAWYDAVGDTPVTLRKLIERAASHEALDFALEEAPIMDRDVINRTKLGRYLGHSVNRVAGGFELQQVTSAHRTQWRVIKVAKVADDG